MIAVFFTISCKTYCFLKNILMWIKEHTVVDQRTYGCGLKNIRLWIEEDTDVFLALKYRYFRSLFFGSKNRDLCIKNGLFCGTAHYLSFHN
jgi:hypothetical protein